MLIEIGWRHRAGMPLGQAVREAGVARFRPVMLTSVTTFLGLAPLLFDKSITAQFLIPMAISLGFGILLATLITLVLVPTNLLIADDIGCWLRGLISSDPAEADMGSSERSAGQTT